MREKLLVITSHKLPGGRFWTECDENVPKKTNQTKTGKQLGPGELVEHMFKSKVQL